MRLFFKSLVAVCASALVAILPASAQSYIPSNQSPILNGGVNNVAGVATNSYASIPYRISCEAEKNLGLFLSFTTPGASNNPVVFVFDQSTDGITFDNVQRYRFTVSASGSAPGTFVMCTNVAMNAVGWLRLYSIENISNAYVTNIVVGRSKKPFQ